MLPTFPLLLLVAWFSSSIQAYGYFEFHLDMFAEVYNTSLKFGNRKMPPDYHITLALQGHWKQWLAIKNFAKNLLPVGELVQAFPSLVMNKGLTENRTAAIKLGRIMRISNVYSSNHDFYTNQSDKYDEDLLPTLDAVYEALITEAQLTDEKNAELFATECRKSIDQILSEFDMIFRTNCVIGNATDSKAECLLEQMVVEYQYTKQNVTTRLHSYNNDLIKLLVMVVLCDYSMDNENRSQIVDQHIAKIAQIAHHTIEYVNWKMGTAWPNIVIDNIKRVAVQYSKIVSIDSAGVSTVGLKNAQVTFVSKMIQERLSSIGNYRHQYQVILSKANSQTVLSTKWPNLIHLTDIFGVDIMVIRSPLDHHNFYPSNRSIRNKEEKILEALESIYSRSNNSERKSMTDYELDSLLWEVGTTVNGIFIQTYSTVLVQQGGNQTDCQLLFDGARCCDTWILTFYTGCIRFFFFY